MQGQLQDGYRNVDYRVYVDVLKTTIVRRYSLSIHYLGEVN